MRKHLAAIVLASAVVTVPLIGARADAITIYTSETAYLDALSAAGHTTAEEGFESEAAWGGVRTTIAGGISVATSVVSSGISWAANNTGSGITTGDTRARTGTWGFFALPHGNYSDPLDPITDGFVGTSVTALAGVGGWFSGQGSSAKIQIILDGTRVASFGGIVIGAQHQFLGVIDPAGFQTFEIRELEGTAEDQNLIFADDFTFGVPGAVMRIELPPGNPAPGDTVRAELVIDVGTAALGAYSVDLQCDDTVVEIVAPILGGSTFEFSGPPIHSASGCSASISAFQVFSIIGPSGLLNVARIDVRVLPGANPGAVALLDLTPIELSDTNGQPIAVVEQDASLRVAGQSSCGNGSLDAGEQCDDGNSVGGDCCATNCTLEHGSCDDGDACTAGDACAAGVCIGVAIPGCATTTTMGGSGGCDPLPAQDCLGAQGATMLVKDHADDSKDQIAWKWTKGEALSQAALGAPTVSTTYSLCIYDSTAGAWVLTSAVDIPPGALWVDKNPKGFSYKDKTGSGDGVTKILLKPGLDGKPKALLKAKGASMPTPAPIDAERLFDQNPSVVAQLHAGPGVCLETVFTPAQAKKNSASLFKAKAKAP